MFGKLFSCCLPNNRNNVTIVKEFTCDDSPDNRNKDIMVRGMNEDDFSNYLNKKDEVEPNGLFQKGFPQINEKHLNFNKSDSFKNDYEKNYKLYYDKQPHKTIILDRLKLLNKLKDTSVFNKMVTKTKVFTQNKEEENEELNLSSVSF